MKYTIDENEIWPEYSLRPVKGDPPAAVEIDNEFIDRYDKAAKEWEDVQDELGKHAERARKQVSEWHDKNACKGSIRGLIFGGAVLCGHILKNGECPRAEHHV